MEDESLTVFKAELDKLLSNRGGNGDGEQAGKWSSGQTRIGHDLNKWRSRIEGPNGLLLLLLI